MTTLVVATAGATAATVDSSARTISGLLVPFGVPGQTSTGRLIYTKGSLRWSDPRRVKLLVEHDQRLSVGYATELVEMDDGLHGTFHVPPGELGDQVLAEASSGVRDGLSVGVELDDVTMQRLRRQQGAAINASGQLRETSSVSVPAFDAARIESVAAAAGGLAVTSWDVVPSPNQEGPAMTTATTPPPAPPAPQPEPQPAPQPAPPAPQQAAAAPASPTSAATAPVATAAATTSAPQPVLAVAGAALQVVSEPSTYTFDGLGPSLVRDAYTARMDADTEAAARLTRYNSELTAGNPSSVMALAAVATTADVGEFIGPTTYRPDLLRSVIDRSRPIITRLGTTPIRNAQPFTLPVEGEFDGVGDHVEGTAHVPEGTFTAGEATMTPRAVSGAYRLSRELVDQSNPALDRIVLRAMVRDYRRHSESKVVAALVAAGGAGTVVTTYMGVRGALAGFVGDDDMGADELFTSPSFLQTLLEEENAGEPVLKVNNQNAGASVKAGYTGAIIDTTELVRASSLPAGDAYAVQNDALLVVESPVQTFRFDEVEGPGIVKLALWAYLGAAVIDASGVERYKLA